MADAPVYAVRADERVWYFAYGSNLDPQRFRVRVGRWSECRAATLRGWRLRFSVRVQSEGGGGAIIEPDGQGVVHGAVFRIRGAQMDAMDRVELDPSRNADAVGVRRRVEVLAGAETLSAEVYTIRTCGPGRAPSATYLEHILRGLEAAGYGGEVVAEVRAAAAAEASS